MPGPRRPARGASARGTSTFDGIYPSAGPHAVAENLRSTLPDATIIAAIHDRTLADVSVPTDATFRLAAGARRPRDRSAVPIWSWRGSRRSSEVTA
jgi:hypothetical protein